MSKSITPLTLRLPERLKENLEIYAERYHRSINKELAARLRESFEIDFNSQVLQRLNQSLPTAKNDCTLGIRLPKELKESCKLAAENHRASLNQEIVIRLHATFDLQIEHEQFKKNKPVYTVQAPTLHTFEEQEVIKLFKALSEKNKKAVMTLIRNLS